MHRLFKLLAVSLAVLSAALPAAAAAARFGRAKLPPQETGFLNRTVVLKGVSYRFQVYLPEDFRRDDKKPWPIILFLHGRGERGSEGMWQTQIGLPEALRDHPERWPFIVVMPQCPLRHYWTEPDMLTLAMSELDQEIVEFHADPARVYLSGLSLGGYGAWELARAYPRRWAAIAVAAGGIFWSYAPSRWKEANTLPAEYARAVGRTPVWVFHGSQDPIVPPREDELMFEAFKANGGHMRFWLYQGLQHDCWRRAFGEPELPRWLLAHRRDQREFPFAERLVIPLHPPELHLTQPQLDALSGDYDDDRGQPAVSVFHRGDQLYIKNIHGETSEVAAESLSSLFYPNGSSIARIAVDRDRQGRIVALTLRDDRHEERWERSSTR